jgi:hypothetical protein
MNNEDKQARMDALQVALSMYLGERCKYCGFLFATIADLDARDVVYAGYHEHGRIACKACWDANNPPPPPRPTDV